MFDPRTDEPGFLTGAVEFLAGIFIFSGIFSLCQILLRCSKIGTGICEHYKINNNGIHDISNKVTSSTFALLACTIGWFVNQQCTGDIMRDRFYITDNFMVLAMSYFLYDLASMYIVHNTTVNQRMRLSVKEIQRYLTEKPLIIFHHILVPLIMIPAVLTFRNGIIRGDCLIGTCLMMEASTPFVSLRVILIHFNKKESLAYVINGLLMLISFFVFRVIIFPYLYWWYSDNTGLPHLAALLSVPWHCHVFTISIWIPQLFWFSKMVKGTIKLIKFRNHPGTTSSSSSPRNSAQNGNKKIS